ncbi:hypothetical protein NMY22_g19929 [Coprinellus aureogranulatus]|nr:hypothetical protein NMY22_g19929 [Coprinellus aureogranulatus]
MYFYGLVGWLECLRKHAGGLLVEKNPNIACIDQSGCNVPFDRSTLKRILNPSGFKLWERLSQIQQLRAARVPNLEFCPLCREYATIIESTPEQQPIFQCENVDNGCGKATCRKCKKENHWPRTCREEELRSVNPAHAVEEAMSEALIRRCPACGIAVVKVHGCNHMACPDSQCGTHFCYLCRKDITVEKYNHFHRNQEHNPVSAQRANGKCLMWDAVRLEDQHDREVNAALPSRPPNGSAAYHTSASHHHQRTSSRGSSDNPGSRKRQRRGGAAS